MVTVSTILLIRYGISCAVGISMAVRSYKNFKLSKATKQTTSN